MQRILSTTRSLLGLDLQERTLPLKFSLPNPTGKFKASSSSGGVDFDYKLNEAKSTPPEFFRLLRDEIKHINRCEIKESQRLSLTRNMLKLFYPMALAQIPKYALTGAVPEPEDRMQLLNMLVDISQILIVSYQILFAEYYASSNFKYSKVRDIVRECVAYIFELLILKQKIKGIRYQLLDAQDWQVANTLFYVMSCYEDVEQPLSTLKKELKLGGGRTEVSLREQFALLHIVAKFDLLHWPTHLQWVVENYMHSVANAVQVKVGDGSEIPGRNILICYCYGTKPASGVPSKEMPGPALILDCKVLSSAIEKDWLGMMQAKKNNDPAAIPPRFARFPETEHFLISNQLASGLELSHEDTYVEKERKVDDFRIFVGFSEVFGLLRHKQGRFGGEERLADALAKRSSAIAEDKSATEKSVWSLLFRNEKLIRLSTLESSYTTSMSIGALLAYGIGDDINRPRLAVVSRIFRPSHKVVVIDMHRVANYAEAVTVTRNTSDPKPSGQNQAKPALLVHDKAHMGEWGLLMPPQDILFGYDKFVMTRNNQPCEITLKNMRNATTDFYNFSTTLESGQLGIEGEPAYEFPRTATFTALGETGVFYSSDIKCGNGVAM